MFPTPVRLCDDNLSGSVFLLEFSPGIPSFHTQKLSGGKQVIKKFDGSS
jgi:hypothetical protein